MFFGVTFLTGHSGWSEAGKIVPYNMLPPWWERWTESYADWLPKYARWHYLACSRLPNTILQENVTNILLTKLVQSSWLDIGLVFFSKHTKTPISSHLDLMHGQLYLAYWGSKVQGLVYLAQSRSGVIWEFWLEIVFTLTVWVKNSFGMKSSEHEARIHTKTFGRGHVLVENKR